MVFEAFLGLIDAGILKRAVDGVILHGAFFLGPKAFYRALREMKPEEIARICMMPVSFTNALYGDEETKRRARVDARFVNNAMMATLMGAAISDGLEDGQVISGVGGQYNFVAQAFALEGARSVLALEAARMVGRRAQSNIRWSYGHQTIPRHLRDVFVTEYGVADVRGKSDEDVIAAMLAIADSRFQDELARQAKDAGKLPKGFEIPAAHRENFPERIAAALKPAREAGLLPSFPFGSDFTEVEQRLIPALQLLQAAQRTPAKLPGLLWEGFDAHARCAADEECLARLGLDRPEYAGRALLSCAGQRGIGADEVNCGTARHALPTRRISVLVHRLALLDEGGHAFGAVFQRKGRVEQVALDVEAFRQRRLEGAVDGFLGHRGGRARHRGDLFRRRHHFAHQLIGRHHAADEAGALGFRRIHHPPGEAEIHRLGFADRAGQALGAADAGNGAERDLGLAELRGVGGDDDVAHHGELAAAAERIAADRGNGRLAAARDAVAADGGEVRREHVDEALRLHLLDVGAGGKGLFAAGHDDAADRVVRLEVVDGGGDLAEDAERQRIEHLRPVQRDDADRAFGCRR